MLQGYKIDLSTNETYPVQLGTRFCLTMTQKSPEALGDVVGQDSTLGSLEVVEALVEAPMGAETATQDVKAKPGRPAKGK